VAIGKSMAARLGERHGGDRKSKEFQAANSGGLNGDTRDLAAEYAGFGGHETYRQAEKVCDEGTPELVALMELTGA
jgi:ParB family chromosome partitioning protein